MRWISFIPQVHFCPQLRAVLLAPGPDQLRLHQDRTRESIYKRPKVVLSVLCLYEEKKELYILLLAQPTFPIFFAEPLGEPRAGRAGPAARRPHPAQQEEGGEGAHVRRGDLHRVLAAPADLPGALRHRPAGQQVSSCPFPLNSTGMA